MKKTILMTLEVDITCYNESSEVKENDILTNIENSVQLPPFFHEDAMMQIAVDAFSVQNIEFKK